MAQAPRLTEQAEQSSRVSTDFRKRSCERYSRGASAGRRRKQQIPGRRDKLGEGRWICSWRWCAGARLRRLRPCAIAYFCLCVRFCVCLFVCVCVCFSACFFFLFFGVFLFYFCRVFCVWCDFCVSWTPLPLDPLSTFHRQTHLRRTLLRQSAQNFTLFFPFRRQFRSFISLSGGVLVELWPRFEAVAHPKCALRLPGVTWGLSHPSSPDFFCVRAPTLRAPTLRAPPFGPLHHWAPTLRAPWSALWCQADAQHQRRIGGVQTGDWEVQQAEST